MSGGGFAWDLRLALRRLRESPVHSTVAVVVLALGLGANTAIFSAVSGGQRRAIPGERPEELVLVWERSRRQGLDSVPVAPAKFLEWRTSARSFVGLAATRAWDYDLEEGSEPLRVHGAQATANLFAVLGVETRLGRGIGPGDERVGAEAVVVLSERLWERQFGADPELLGRTVSLDGRPHVVVGILPREHWFPFPNTQIWVPLPVEAQRDVRSEHTLGVIGRLRPGLTPRRAQDELASLADRFAREHPATDEGWEVRVASLPEESLQGYRSGMAILALTAGTVLLIACANVASLLLARAVAREKEFAMEAALGAAPVRLGRRLVTESVVLALLGGSFGLLVARWSIDVLGALPPDHLAFVRQFIAFDRLALAFALLASLTTGIVFGALPALHAVRTELARSLVEGTGTGSAGRAVVGLKWLVICEIAMAYTLIVTAEAMSATYSRVQEVPLGFREGPVLTFGVSLPPARYPEAPDILSFQRELLERLGSLPEVDRVALASSLPLLPNLVYRGFQVEGRPPPRAAEQPVASLTVASPEYLDVLGIRLLEGRPFSTRDRLDAPPVALVSERLARQHWPEESAVGRRLRLRGEEAPLEIVGVLEDVRDSPFAPPPFPQLYLPHEQRVWGFTYFVLATEGDPTALASPVQRVVRALDPKRPLFDVQALDQIVKDAVWAPRFASVVVGALAVLATVLAAAGLYGHVSHLVVRRTQEFGVRSAFGASPGSLVRLLLSGSLQLVLVGVALGAPLVHVAMRVLLGTIPEAELATPADHLRVAATLAAVAVVATLVPAYRTSRLDPAVALRDP